MCISWNKINNRNNMHGATIKLILIFVAFQHKMKLNKQSQFNPTKSTLVKII